MALKMEQLTEQSKAELRAHKSAGTLVELMVGCLENEKDGRSADELVYEMGG
jgi:hypothetical protein